MAANDEFVRAVYHLEIWGEWRRVNRGSVTRGYPSNSCGLASGGASQDFDSMVEKEDEKSAAIADSVIDGLPELLRLALEHRYILRGVLKSNRADAEIVLREAHARFWERARRNLV